MEYVKLAVVAVMLAFVAMADCSPRMERYHDTQSHSNGTNSSSSQHHRSNFSTLQFLEKFGLADKKRVQETLLDIEFSRIETKLGKLRGLIAAIDSKLKSQSSTFSFERKAKNVQHVREALTRLLGVNILYLEKAVKQMAFEGQLATSYIHPFPRFPPMINANSSSNTNETSNPNNFRSIQRPVFFRFRKSTTQAPVTKTTTAAPAVKDEGKDTARKPIEAVAASISEQSALDETNTKESDVKAVAESILDQYYDEYY